MLGVWVLFTLYTLMIAASLIFMAVAIKSANIISSDKFDKMCMALQVSILGLLFLALLIGCFLQ